MAEPHPLAHVSPRAIRVFVLEELVGLPLLALVALTVLLSPHIQRRAAWMNVYAAFILNSIVSLMLFFTKQLHTDRPPFGLCLAQAVLMYSTSSLCGASIVILSIRIWIEAHHQVLSTCVSRAMIVVPWSVATVIAVEAIVVGIFLPMRSVLMPRQIGLQKKTTVVRGASPYCWMTNRVPSYTAEGLIILCLVAALVLQVITARRLWILRRRLKSRTASHMGLGAMISITTRLILFNLGSISGAAVAAAYVGSQFTDLPHIIQGAWSLLGFAVFGCSSDIIKAWTTSCRRRRASPMIPMVEVASNSGHTAHIGLDREVLHIGSDKFSEGAKT